MFKLSEYLKNTIIIFILHECTRFAYLSRDMHINTLLERNKPKILKNEKNRHMKSPACHITVADHPISKGIIINVTCNKKYKTH